MPQQRPNQASDSQDDIKLPAPLVEELREVRAELSAQSKDIAFIKGSVALLPGQVQDLANGMNALTAQTAGRLAKLETSAALFQGGLNRLILGLLIGGGVAGIVAVIKFVAA